MLKVKTGTAEAAPTVSFVQHDLPGLKAGKYKLKAAQELVGAGNVRVNDEPMETEYSFGVGGDRFALSDPAGTVYSVFPAENASGRYSTAMPSVVFTKTSLPWTRTPENAGKVKESIDVSDRDVPSWLTVLLLDEQDVERQAAKFPDFKLDTAPATIGDLFPASAYGESTLGDNHSYFDAVRDAPDRAARQLEPGQRFTDPVSVLDIPAPLFTAIAPSAEDLKYMAHIRIVGLEKKATMKGISDTGRSVGSFSIVFGNRLPASGRKTHAYLVSLEGMETLLPGGRGPQEDRYVRLAVLKEWTFYSTGDDAEFRDRLRRLNGAGETPEGEPVNPGLNLATTLAVPCPAEAAIEVRNALGMGYVPMDHIFRTATGESGGLAADRSVSWMRGPLLPYDPEETYAALTADSSDKLLAYDPTTGMLDVSYAAAWTLGRQLALEDKGFSTSLYNWRTRTETFVDNRIDTAVLLRTLRPAMQAAANPDEKTEGNIVKKIMMSVR